MPGGWVAAGAVPSRGRRRRVLTALVAVVAVADMQRIVAEDVPLISLYIPNRIQLFNKSLFDAWYFTPGGVFGGYPGVLNKHVFVTGKQAGF